MFGGEGGSEKPSRSFARDQVRGDFVVVQLGGRLVANLISIGALDELRTSLGKHAAAVQVWMINVSRGSDQLQRLRFDALNPTFLIEAKK